MPSLASTVKAASPPLVALVGVPLMTPVPGSRLSPSTNVPETMVKVVGVKPNTCGVLEIAAPTATVSSARIFG